jgi:hypothetical protein
MPNVLKFFESTSGRLLRILAGIALVIYGLFFSGSIAGYVVAVVGLLVFAVSASDRCVFASLCGVGPKDK